MQLGGSRDRIIVRPLRDVATDALHRLRLQEFSTARAQCRFSYDRHSLLAVIESSFGELSAFDKAVHGLFQDVAPADAEGGGGGDDRAPRIVSHTCA